MSSDTYVKFHKKRGGGAPAPIKNAGILLNKLCISSNILKGHVREC